MDLQESFTSIGVCLGPMTNPLYFGDYPDYNHDLDYNHYQKAPVSYNLNHTLLL